MAPHFIEDSGGPPAARSGNGARSSNWSRLLLMNGAKLASRSPHVAFLVPFLGRWPKWSRLFFRSIEANPSVDIVLLCEHVPPWSMPPNVSINKFTKAEIISRVKSAIGLELKSISGHKLCDFKPFYGLIFADLLKDYQFWGFCDVDMMFGDIGKLFNSGFLEKIDVFTSHNSHVVGHFTVLRNTEAVNRSGFGIFGWQDLCLRSTTQMVDELPFSVALSKNASLRWLKVDTLPSELEKRFSRFGITFTHSGEIAYLEPSVPALVEWREGRVYYSDVRGAASEALYVHFMGLKHWWHWCLSDRNLGSHRFSRIGYGGPDSAQALLRSPWQQIYIIQTYL